MESKFVANLSTMHGCDKQTNKQTDRKKTKRPGYTDMCRNRRNFYWLKKIAATVNVKYAKSSSVVLSTSTP